MTDVATADTTAMTDDTQRSSYLGQRQILTVLGARLAGRADCR
jgi:hypothetical protein